MNAHAHNKKRPLKEDNFLDYGLVFRDRQAGVSLVYDPNEDRYYYNAYCVETRLFQELFSCEYESLDEALEVINSEFGTWELKPLSTKNCGSCGNA